MPANAGPVNIYMVIYKGIPVDDALHRKVGFFITQNGSMERGDLVNLDGETFSFWVNALYSQPCPFDSQPPALAMVHVARAPNSSQQVIQDIAGTFVDNRGEYFNSQVWAEETLVELALSGIISKDMADEADGKMNWLLDADSTAIPPNSIY